MRSRISIFSLPSDPNQRFILAAVFVLALAAAVKACLLIGDAFPFNADEAVVALMADHILGGEWPVFFYGQAYMGSLDATMTAGLFALFGRTQIWIRVLQSVLYLASIITSMQLARKATNSALASLATGLLMAVPTLNVTLYTSVSLGGYGEALLIGNLLLLIAFQWLDRDGLTLGSLAGWGLLAGVGFWAFGLTVVYVLPTLVVLVWKLSKFKSWSARIGRGSAAILGVLIGLTPLLYWAMQNSPQLLLDEFLGAAIRDTTPQSGLQAVLAHTLNLLLFGTTVIFGFRPPWSTEWLAPVLSIFPLLFWSLLPASLLLKIQKREPLNRKTYLLAGVMVCTVGGFLFTPFGNDPSGRYFLPLYPILAIGAGMLLHSLYVRPSQRYLAMVLLWGTLIFNLWVNIQAGFVSEEKITTQFDSITRIDHSYDQALIEFLIQEEEFTGYTNYWVAYPLAFQSQERLIFIPALPYHPDLRHTQRDNRYQPYSEVVSSSDRWAYITTHNPALDDWLQQGLSAQGAEWQETWIGDYHIYYQIEPPLNLDAMGGFD
jgi:hypothetical protein